MSPHGLGETAATYLAHAEQFSRDMTWAGELFATHPELRGMEAHIRPGRVEIVTFGLNGALRDWTRALPPIVVHDTGLYTSNQLVGVTDVLKTGHCTVTVRRPLS